MISGLVAVPIMRLGLVLFLSYIVFFIAFFPGKWGEAWIRAGVPDFIQWQGLQLDWHEMHWQKVGLPVPGRSAALVFTEVIVTPNFLPLLWGSPSADYRIRHGGGHVDGTVQWSMAALQVQWQVQVDDFSMFQALFSLPVAMTGSGVGEGQVVLDWSSKALRTGSWNFKGNNISFLDVVLESFKLKGDVLAGNLMEVHISGKGNVAIAGQVKVQMRSDALAASQLSGRMQIQPLAGRLQGMVGVALQGKPAALIIGGNVRQPSWNIQ